MATPRLLSICKTVQANLHHSRTATAQIRKWLEDNDEAIALIQEPWIRSNIICGLNRFSGKLFYSSGDSPPRTCIVATDKIQAQILTQFCSSDLTTIKLKQSQDPRTPELVVASAYMPEGDTAPPESLVELVRFCEQNKMELVIGTDSNAHHQLWGMPSNNKRGEDLVDFLFTTDLGLLNTGTEPTFVTRRFRTIIDLTLATGSAAELISDWHVSTEASCSDHRWIRFNIAVPVTMQSPKRIPKKTNQKLYTNLANRSLRLVKADKFEDQAAIEKTVVEVTNIIISSYEAACQPTIPVSRSGNSWWGPELARLRKRVRKLFNRAMNTYDEQDWDAYKEAKAFYKKRIRYWNDGSWRKFCTEIKSCSTANKVRKMLSKDKQK